MKRVLMVAFHFPPLAGSSGIQRTLRFVQDLPAFGWQPLVLSAHPRAYVNTGSDLLEDIPQGTVVRRAFALDASRHLSIAGRHFAFLARPDRWTNWRYAAIHRGLQMIREFSPDAIWSTHPIPTAHAIGAALQRRSGIPWIADFRDPMAQDGYPPDPATWRQYRTIEEQAVLHARFSTFTTPSAVRMYRERYPDCAERIVLLENGFDERSFAAAEQSLRSGPGGPLNEGAITLLHSGIVYPEERDPTQVFVALRRLQDEGLLDRRPLVVRFRAPVHAQLLNGLAQQHGVQARIEVCPSLPYRQALAEMLRADGLLVLQAANCNEQVPAKIYEYLRARRPIVCLSDPRGDTATVLAQAGCRLVAPLDDGVAIAQAFARFLDDETVRQPPSEQSIAAASRLSRTQSLAGFLDRMSAGVGDARSPALAA